MTQTREQVFVTNAAHRNTHLLPAKPSYPQVLLVHCSPSPFQFWHHVTLEVTGFCSHWLMQFQWMVTCYDMPPLQLLHCCTLQIWEQKIRKMPGWVGDVLFWSHHKDSFHQQWSGFTRSLKDWEKWDKLFKALKVCENWGGSVNFVVFRTLGKNY